MTTMHNRQRYKSERHHALDNIATGPWKMPPPRRYLPACSGPCEQGKNPCSTPDACQLPMFAATKWASRAIAAALAIGATAVAAAVFWP